MQRAMHGLILVAIGLSLAALAPLGAEVLRFEGDLFAGGHPAEGPFDFRFRLLDGPDGATSSELAEPLERYGVEVAQGRFRVELEFDLEVPKASPTWLAVEVARSGSGDRFAALEPARPIMGPGELTPEDNFPAGTVAFFDLPACPSGWTELTAARGRTLVGLPSGGTLGGTQGTALSDLEARVHSHTFSTSVTSAANGHHSHAWSSILYSGSDVQWTSWDQFGSPVLAFNWTNGVDNEGSGIYPLTATPNATFFTASQDAHTHLLTFSGVPTSSNGAPLPYLQLLACRKG